MRVHGIGSRRRKLELEVICLKVSWATHDDEIEQTESANLRRLSGTDAEGWGLRLTAIFDEWRADGD